MWINHPTIFTMIYHGMEIHARILFKVKVFSKVLSNSLLIDNYSF
jgi:hypothetical protein